MINFLLNMPKAELHMHLEGSIEPEMMMTIGRRNDIKLPFADENAARAAYQFKDLQSFLDIYYRSADVLQTEQEVGPRGCSRSAAGTAAASRVMQR